MDSTPATFPVHATDIFHHRNEPFRLVRNIISQTRQALVHSRVMRHAYLPIVLNRPVSATDELTDLQDKQIQTYFADNFPEIRIQHLPFSVQGEVHHWNTQTIFLNYELAHAVNAARSYPGDDRYDNNVLLLFLAALFHEYGYTLGSYIHGESKALTELGERGHEVEKAMFGGVISPHYGVLGLDYRRIEDLQLDHKPILRLAVTEATQTFLEHSLVHRWLSSDILPY